MAQTGPASILQDRTGTEVAVQNAATIDPAQPLIPLAGSDGTDQRAVKTDTAGNLAVVGTGVAGTPAGGVLSVQGVVGGTPLAVTSTDQKSTVSATTLVAGSAVSVTILAANATRLGAVVVNDNNKILYLKLGAGPATSSSYTYKMAPDDRVEVPFDWVGIVTGIWTAAGSGNGAVVTEFTP